MINKVLIAVVLMATPCAADYVNAESGLCVRAEPTTESEILDILPFGTEVDGGEGEWIPFEGGYIASEWICEDNPMEYIGTWLTTAYGATGSPCANGQYPEVGVTIAHNTLPMGTKLYIEDVGVRIVEDRGPTWLGSEWCDIYLGETGACIQYGEQMHKVYLVKERE